MIILQNIIDMELQLHASFERLYKFMVIRSHLILRSNSHYSQTIN